MLQATLPTPEIGTPRRQRPDAGDSALQVRLLNLPFAQPKGHQASGLRRCFSITKLLLAAWHLAPIHSHREGNIHVDGTMPGAYRTIVMDGGTSLSHVR